MKTLLLLLFFTSTLIAQNDLENNTTKDSATFMDTLKDIAKEKALSFLSDDLKLDLIIDENSKKNPDLYFPWMWNSKLETAIEYRVKEALDSESTATSNIDETLGTTVFKLHALKYTINSEAVKWQLGTGYGYDLYDKYQTGYFASGSINFDHQVDIEVHSLTIHADATFYKLTDNVSAQFAFIMTPVTQLKVSQNTSFTGGLNLSAVGSSTESLNPSFELNTRVACLLPFHLHLGLETRYQYLPLKYSLKVLNQSATGFNTKAYDLVEHITNVAIKLYWDTDIFWGLLPTIGYSQEYTVGISNLDSSTYDNTKQQWIVGLNKIF